MGYSRAGFDEIIGVDIAPQPRYPFEFVQADALEFLADHGHEFDAIHASPPCQPFTALRTMWNSRPHQDLLTPSRALLKKLRRPYVIENVPGAPMEGAYIQLCGSMFGLGTGEAELRRHRLFELGGFYLLTPQCLHYQRDLVIGVYGGHGRDWRRTIAESMADIGNGPTIVASYRETVLVTGNADGSSVRDGCQQCHAPMSRREAMGKCHCDDGTVNLVRRQYCRRRTRMVIGRQLPPDCRG